MATRYKCTGFFPIGDINTYSVYIDDANYTGAVSEIELASPGFTINYEGDSDEIKGGLMGSACKVPVMITGSAMEPLIQDIALSKEGRFTIKITQTTGGVESLFWCGIVLPDITEMEDFIFPYVATISATDGVSRLKDLDYKSGTQPYGNLTFIQHITNVLNLDNTLPALYWGASDTFLLTLAEWYETGHGTITAAKCPLAYTRVNGEIFAEKKSTNIWKFKSAFDVLNSICQHWRMRLYLAGGSWRAEQYNSRRNTFLTYRKFDKTGAFLSAQTVNYNKTVGNNRDGSKLSHPATTWLPALNRVIVDYDHASYKNQLAGESYRWGSSGLANSELVIPNIAFETNSFIKIAGKIRYKITSAATVPFRFLFLGRLKLDTGHQLKRETDVVPNQYLITQDAPTWFAGNAWIEFSTDFIFEPSLNISNSVEGEITFAIWTPAVPSGASEVRFDINEDVAYDAAGGSVAATLTEWSVTELAMTFEGVDTPDNKEVARRYQADNPTVGNTKQTEFVHIFGHPVNKWTPGKLQVSANGSAWADASQTWGAGAAGAFEFGQLFAVETLAQQKVATRRTSAQITGRRDIYPWLKYVFLDGFNYIFIGGKFTGEDETLDGDYWEVYYNPGGITQNTKKITANPDPTTVGGAAGSAGLFVPNGATQAPLNISSDIAIAALTTNYTNTAISAGALSSIPLQFPAKANSYLAGDTIMILHPGTGKIYPLTVTAANAEGATSLAVSGSIGQAVPKGSIVLYGVLNKYTNQGGSGASVLPPLGSALQILRINSAGTALEWFTLSMPSGTVTSVGLSLPASIFSVTGSPVTGSGTLTAALANQSINAIFAGPASGGAGAPVFRALVTADLPNQVVTLSKLQNITTSRILGRQTAGSGVVEELTPSQAAAIIGALTGSGAAAEVAFFTAAQTQASSSNFRWDNTNSFLAIGPGVMQAILNVYGPSGLTGDVQFIRCSNNINGRMQIGLVNASGLTSGAVNYLAEVSAGAGDATMQFVVTGGARTWTLGLDNSVTNDPFKIARAAALGTAATDEFILEVNRAAIAGAVLVDLVNLAIGGTGGVRIPSGTAAQRPASGAGAGVMRHSTAVGGLEYQNQFGQWVRITCQSAIGAITGGTGAGAGATITAVGTDAKGVVTVTAGTASAAGGVVFTLNFGNAFSTTPNPIICAYSANFYAAGFYVDTASNGAFSVRTSNALTSGQAYKIGFINAN